MYTWRTAPIRSSLAAEKPTLSGAALSSSAWAADDNKEQCAGIVKAGHPPFNAKLTELLDAYAGVFGATSTNYLVFAQYDSLSPELLKLAIEKNHSIDPDAIKNALETMGPVTIWDIFKVANTPDNHTGIVGDYGANVCNMAPLVDGAYRQPTIAP